MEYLDQSTAVNLWPSGSVSTFLTRSPPAE
jgi:hypothetical protein